jgi:hypothetical protein
MTIVLAAGNAEQLVQIADRRLVSKALGGQAFIFESETPLSHALR